MSRQLLRMSDSHRSAIDEALSSLDRKPEDQCGSSGIVPAAMIASCLEKPDAAGRVMTAFGGGLFEDWLEKQAARLGLSCDNLSAKRLPYDLVINGHRVQAKCSASQKGCVDVRPVRPAVGSHLRRYSIKDFDVLAVYLSYFKEVFFVPVSCFEDEAHAGSVRGSFRRDACAEWINAWSVLTRDGASPNHCRRPTQGTFVF